MGLAAAACAGLVLDGPASGPGAGVDPAPDPAPGFVPVEPLLRRLTSEELVYTLEDVVGVSLPAAARAALPVDRPLAGFVNTASGQSVVPDHVLAFAEVALAVVADPAFAGFVDRHAGCRETRPACGEALVGSMGRDLFRRPLDARERAAFAGLFDVATGEGLSFSDAAAIVARAMLQSPQFLYRVELEVADGFEGLRVVNGHEMATRLSYLLWASAPDATLYEAAATGALDTPEGVLAQVDRMLADTRKTRRVLERFLVDWARLASLPDDDGLREELIDAAVAFYVGHVEGGDPLLDLFTVERATLTPALARGYGLEPSGPGLQRYDLTDVPGRVGLLAQPGVVAGMTNADGGAIVARGLFLLGQVFCGDVPDPPASLQSDIDAFVDEQPPDASDREIAEARLERRDCATCHRGFDPLAYGFEQLDHRGRHRLEDEHGNVLRTDGWVPAGLGESSEPDPYEDLEGLAARLRGTTRVRSCFVKRHLEYMLGAPLDNPHAGSVDALRARLEAGDGRWDSLVRAVVVHDLFRTMPMAGGGEGAR